MIGDTSCQGCQFYKVGHDWERCSFTQTEYPNARHSRPMRCSNHPELAAYAKQWRSSPVANLNPRITLEAA